MLVKLKRCYKKLKENIKHLNSVIKHVQIKTDKYYIKILFDILLCKIIYFLEIEEYKILEFYNVNNSLRKTYLNFIKHDLIKPLLYRKDNLIIIKNKNKFLQRFDKYIKREIKNINNISFKEFEETLLKNKKVICRSQNSSFVDSYEIYDLSKFRGPGFVLEKAKKNNLVLVEKYIEQHKKLKEISENLVIINLVTMFNKGNVDVISSYITYKENNEVIRRYIDIKKGKLKGHLRDSKYNIYQSQTINHEIPHLQDMISFVKDTAKEIDEIKEVEWSLCLDNKGKIYLMDATTWKHYIYSQIPEHLNKKIGLLPYYKKIISKK